MIWLILYLFVLLVYLVSLIAFLYDYDSLINTVKEHYEHFGARKRIPYPVYYINLDRSTKRNEFMKSQFQKLGINATRFSAVDGNNITVKYFNSYSGMTKYEVGCTLSHLQTIKQAYDAGHEIAMICEDDVWLMTLSLIPDLDQVVSKAPSNWKIIQVQNMRPSRGEGLKFIKSFEKKYAFGAACYLINRRGMKQILDATFKNGVWHIAGSPKRGIADIFLYHLTTTYFTSPSLFVQNNTKLTSDIGGIRGLGHLWSMRKTLTALLTDEEMDKLNRVKTISKLENV